MFDGDETSSESVCESGSGEDTKLNEMRSSLIKKPIFQNQIKMDKMK